VYKSHSDFFRQTFFSHRNLSAIAAQQIHKLSTGSASEMVSSQAQDVNVSLNLNVNHAKPTVEDDEEEDNCLTGAEVDLASHRCVPFVPSRRSAPEPLQTNSAVSVSLSKAHCNHSPAD
jgi:hypothetical protein